MKRLLPILLMVLCSLSSRAQTNIVKRTLPSATSFSITYYPKDSGVWIEIPDYKTTMKVPGKMAFKRITFNEIQKLDVIVLFQKFLSFAITLEENGVKSFSKSLGSIRQVNDDLKWAVGMDGTIYISQEGKSQLILELKDKLTGFASLIVLDWNEARSVVDLISMVPEMQKEAQTKSSK